MVRRPGMTVSEPGDHGQTACSMSLFCFGCGGVNGTTQGKGWITDLLFPCPGHGRSWPSRRGNRRRRRAFCSCAAPTLPSPVRWHQRPQPPQQPPSACVVRCQLGWELYSVTYVRTGSMGDVCQSLASLAPQGPLPPHPHCWLGGSGTPNSYVLCACAHGAHAWRPS